MYGITNCDEYLASALSSDSAKIASKVKTFRLRLFACLAWHEVSFVFFLFYMLTLGLSKRSETV